MSPDSQSVTAIVTTTTTAPFKSSSTETCLLPMGSVIASSSARNSGSTPVKWSSTISQIVNAITRSEAGSHGGLPKTPRIV